MTVGLEELKRRMECRRNLRNVCIISNNGASDLFGCLGSSSFVVIQQVENPVFPSRGGCGFDVPYVSDSRICNIIHKLTSEQMSLITDGDQFEVENTEKVDEFFISILNTPDNIEFSYELAATIRLTDSAIIVIDCLKDVTSQVSQFIELAVKEQPHCILFIDNLQEALIAERMPFVKLYQRCSSILNKVNNLLDEKLDPLNGTVIFGSSSNEWAFELEQFGRMYAEKLNLTSIEMTSKLWSDNYFKNKEWSTKTEAEQENAFCKFVLEPITKLYDSVLNLNSDEIVSLAETRLNIKIPPSHFKEWKYSKTDTFKYIMARWLPICPPVLSSICIHLPSAVKGQKQGVDGQLMIQVGRLLIPSSFKYFYALGRVMSGRAEKDQLVCVLNDGKESWKKLKAVMLIGGNRANEIESASAGSIVGIVGLDQFITADCTISNATAKPFLPIQYLQVNTIRVSVKSELNAEMNELVDAIKSFVKTDPSVKYEYDKELKKHFITTNGEQHLNACIRNLETNYLRYHFKKPICVENVVE